LSQNATGGLVDWGAAMCYLSSNRFTLGVLDMVVADLSALSEVVQEAIGEERLGQPQFLRCLAQVSADCLGDAIDEWIALGEAWFGSSVATRHRLGEGSGVYLTEMAKWETGQAALITVSSTGSNGTPAIDLMLIGSRGTIYHEGAAHA
jgi:hypothetical protein